MVWTWSELSTCPPRDPGGFATPLPPDRAKREARPMFEDQAFDAAPAQLVVHLMADPVAGLREMARVTRERGIVRLGSRWRQGRSAGSGKRRASSIPTSRTSRTWRAPVVATLPSCPGSGAARHRGHRSLSRPQASELRGLVGAVHAWRRLHASRPGPPDAVSVGMSLQTLLLALTARGLGLCVEVSIALRPPIIDPTSAARALTYEGSMTRSRHRVSVYATRSEYSSSFPP